MTIEKNTQLILVVDDEAMIGELYKTKLELDGYRVNIASNGKEGLASVAKEKPDLILLDLLMPQMTGVEMLNILKTDPQTSKIPVIIITNLLSKPDDIKKAQALGACDYLIKSNITLDELSKRVKETLAIDH